MLFSGGVASALHQWMHINNYSYCFLIIPLMAHMIWTNRDHLRDLAPEPSPWGALVIALFGVAWSLAYISGLAEAVELAIVGIIQGLLVALFGARVYRRLWLPFTYLWLLVPTGEFLIPGLQSATAFGAAALLDLSGIPTYREALTIMVPSGSYAVAPGCSGLSFLLSALVISVTFADTFYRGRTKKVMFVLASLGVGVAGNAARVFSIIAIAHVTNNIGDIADDHLLYGWAFFSVLLLGVLAFGYRFRDDRPPRSPGGPGAEGRWISPARIAWSAALALVALIAAPLAVSVALPDVGNTFPTPPPALSCGTFLAGAPQPRWRMAADPPAVDGVAAIDCTAGGRSVHLVLAILERPVRRGKLMGLERRLIDRDHWIQLDVRQSTTVIDGRPAPVQTERIGRGDARRLVWSLFWTGGGWRAAGLDTVWNDIASDLAGHRRAAAIVVGTEAFGGGPEAAALLWDFLAGLSLGPLVGGDVRPASETPQGR